MMPFSPASVISSDSGYTDGEGPLSVQSIRSVDSGLGSENPSSVPADNMEDS